MPMPWIEHCCLNRMTCNLVEDESYFIVKIIGGGTAKAKSKPEKSVGVGRF